MAFSSGNDLNLEHAQHLLRHLHDPLALDRNPLMERLGIGAVRKILERLCAAMENEAIQHPRDSSIVRQYEIFRRCDLAREPHAKVAGDLGISRRQFYRERRRIAGRVADAFAQLASNATALEAMAQGELTRLIRLARWELERGNVRAAMAVLDAVESSGCAVHDVERSA